MRTPLAAALLTLLTACSEPSRPTAAASAAPLPSASVPRAIAPSFPAFPATPAAARDLVARETKRAAEPDREVDAAAILAAIAARPGSVVAGEIPVARWIEARMRAAPKDAYLLVGTFHDSAGQIDAFRRLVGPLGVRGLSVVAVEQLRADGAWSGVPIEEQRGDGAAIDAYVAQGDAEAFAALARGHRDSDYAAWKLGYEANVLDLLVNARATRVTFLGCDLPRPLQERLKDSPAEIRNRVREIHCLHALPPAPGDRPRRAALLWGMAHVRRDGLRRFLPPEARVLALHVFGRRLAAGAVESGLGKALIVNDVALVPLGEDEAALLLPDEILGGKVDRVLTAEGAGSAGVFVRSEIDGVVSFGSREPEVTKVGRAEVQIPLPPGEHTYVLSAGDLRVLGAVRVEEGARVELGFDPKGRGTSLMERGR